MPQKTYLGPVKWTGQHTKLDWKVRRMVNNRMKDAGNTVTFVLGVYRLTREDYPEVIRLLKEHLPDWEHLGESVTTVRFRKKDDRNRKIEALEAEIGRLKEIIEIYEMKEKL